MSCLYFDLETYVGEDGVLIPNLAVSYPQKQVALFLFMRTLLVSPGGAK